MTKHTAGTRAVRLKTDEQQACKGQVCSQPAPCNIYTLPAKCLMMRLEDSPTLEHICTQSCVRAVLACSDNPMVRKVIDFVDAVVETLLRAADDDGGSSSGSPPARTFSATCQQFGTAGGVTEESGGDQGWASNDEEEWEDEDDEDDL